LFAASDGNTAAGFQLGISRVIGDYGPKCDPVVVEIADSRTLEDGDSPTQTCPSGTRAPLKQDTIILRNMVNVYSILPFDYNSSRPDGKHEHESTVEAQGPVERYGRDLSGDDSAGHPAWAERRDR
jgi:hypothetical protein